MMLIGFARDISLAHKMRARAGVRKAEYLEAVLFSALVQLSADIVSAESPEGPLSKSDETALADLKTIHALLGVITLMVRQLKADLMDLAERFAALSQVEIWLDEVLPLNPERVTGFLDSG